MRVCLICVEIFAWGKYGGFGRATRTIGRELARRGVEVFAVVPQRAGQGPVERLDGITVLAFPPARPLRMLRLFREVDADVYHSCEPSLGTYLARRAMPGRRHMVTVRDPRDLADWARELARPSLNRAQVVGNYLFESNPLVAAAVRRADAVYTTAPFLVAKVERMYAPRAGVHFLPTPVEIPKPGPKADRPTICFLARLDRRKRPELFFDLAVRFPEVRLVAMGRSRDPGFDRRLRATYDGIPNVEFLGFVDQFASDLHGRTLGASWIVVNTASREGLPNAFLEAAAHGCAILSAVDPDGFASRFGYHAAADDFAHGLAHLLAGDRWRERGRAAREHVAATFAQDRAVDLHVEAYRSLLGGKVAARPSAPSRASAGGSARTLPTP